MDNKLIDQKILFTQNAIQNTLQVEPIQTVLAKYGYNQAKMNEGQAILDRASVLNQKQKKEYGEQYQATKDLNMARAETNSIYIKHLKIARVAFGKNQSAIEALQLSGRRKTSLSGWINQVKTFYTNALNSTVFTEKIAEYGITVEILENGLAIALNTEKLYNNQLKEIGEAQQTTLDRDTAFDELEDWVTDFCEIAKAVLVEQPQYLEILGIKA